MNKTRNILIIVEGKRREREFFERLCGIFNIDYKIFTYETNIYSLYSEMKSYDFNADIIKVLKGLNKSSENSEIFENKFAFVYLVFDFEIQHNSVHGVFNKEQIEKNLTEIKEMANYFTNETEPTVGKLYINFPMFESYRDISLPLDANYKNRICKLEDIQYYRRDTGVKTLANMRINELSENVFKEIAYLNILKVNFIVNNLYNFPSIDVYREISLFKIIQCEESSVWKGFISVLNTSIFFIVDYFGNNNNFYKNLSLLSLDYN